MHATQFNIATHVYTYMCGMYFIIGCNIIHGREG